MIDTRLEEWFTYHPPTVDQRVRYERLRDGAKAFAYVLLETTPASADQTAAFRLLRESVMTANASIALEKPLDAKT